MLERARGDVIGGAEGGATRTRPLGEVALPTGIGLVFFALSTRTRPLGPYLLAQIYNIPAVLEADLFDRPATTLHRYGAALPQTIADLRVSEETFEQPVCNVTADYNI